MKSYYSLAFSFCLCPTPSQAFLPTLRYTCNVCATSLVQTLYPEILRMLSRSPMEADHTTPQLVAGINDKKTFKKPENIQLQQAEYIYSLRNIVKYD